MDLVARHLDLDWYRRQSDADLPDRRRAAEHYLAVGRRLLLSPHPFFVPSDDEVGPSPFERALEHEGWGQRPPFPLWRPEPVDGTSGRSFADLLAGLDDDTRLTFRAPDGPAQLSWGELRRTWTDFAATWASTAGEQADVWRVVENDADRAAPSVLSPALDVAASETRVTVLVAHDAVTAAGLRRALDSVRAQTHRHLDVLVADASTDPDLELVLGVVASRDPRVRRIDATGLGRLEALELARTHATGEVVAYASSTTEWEPTHLAALLKRLDAEPAAVAAHDTAAQEVPDGLAVRGLQAELVDLLQADHVALETLAVRRSALEEAGGLDPALGAAAAHALTIGLHDLGAVAHVATVGVRRQQVAAEPVPERDLGAEGVAVSRHLVGWGDAMSRSRRGVSLVLPVVSSTRALTPVLKAAQEAWGDDWQGVVVDATPGPRLAAALAVTVVAHRLSVTYLRRPAPTSWALLVDLGLAATTGEVVVIVDESTTIDAAGLRRLTEHVATHPDDLVQPVCVRNHVVEQAGGVFGPRRALPWPRWASLSFTDLATPEPLVEVEAGLGGVFAARGERLCALKGLDPLVGDALATSDMTLRGRAAGLRTVVAADVRATIAAQGAPQSSTTPGSRERRAFEDRWAHRVPALPDPVADHLRLAVHGWVPSEAWSDRRVLVGPRSPDDARWRIVPPRKAPDWMPSWTAALAEALAADGVLVTTGAAGAGLLRALDDVVLDFQTPRRPEPPGEWLRLRWSVLGDGVSTGPVVPDPVAPDLVLSSAADPRTDLRDRVPTSTGWWSGTLEHVDPTPSADADRHLLVVGDPARWRVLAPGVDLPVRAVGSAWEGVVDDVTPWPDNAEQWHHVLASAGEVLVLHDLAAADDTLASPPIVDALVVRGAALTDLAAPGSVSPGLRRVDSPGDIRQALAAPSVTLTRAQRREFHELVRPSTVAARLRGVVDAARRGDLP